MNNKLLTELKDKARTALSKNDRFHDIAHALEVLDNVKNILEFESGDEDILFTSALFHDVSNISGEKEGEDGANITREILKNVSDFPKDKIEDVCRLIVSISGEAKSPDEIIINEADRMAIFSKLSIVRGFMIYSKRGLQPEEALKDFLNFIERKYSRFKLKSAKALIEDDYIFIKNFLSDCLSQYKDN